THAASSPPRASAYRASTCSNAPSSKSRSGLGREPFRSRRRVWHARLHRICSPHPTGGREMKTLLIAACLAAALCVLPTAPAWADAALPPQPRPGDIPPDVLGNDRDGNPVTVSQHRGKVVIVTFWASWCGP